MFFSIFKSNIENLDNFGRWWLSKDGNLKQTNKSDHSMGEAGTTFAISFNL